MEPIFITDRIKDLLPQVKAFVLSELVPLEVDHITRPFKETEKILAQKKGISKSERLVELSLTCRRRRHGFNLM